MKIKICHNRDDGTLEAYEYCKMGLRKQIVSFYPLNEGLSLYRHLYLHSKAMQSLDGDGYIPIEMCGILLDNENAMQVVDELVATNTQCYYDKGFRITYGEDRKVYVHIGNRAVALKRNDPGSNAEAVLLAYIDHVRTL
jgi:hypothetical protein